MKDPEHHSQADAPLQAGNASGSAGSTFTVSREQAHKSQMCTTAPIDILLATYNGEQYLAEQMDSILGQTERSWRLIIRDDGSTDGTLGILHRYAAQYPDKIVVVENPMRRLGALGNFSALMEVSDADYTMFCDQDDVWLPDKIRVSLDALRSLERQFRTSTPLLVHTDLSVVGPHLEVLHPSVWKYQVFDPVRGRALNRMLVQNPVTGCAIMINRALRELAVPVPSEARMHDWWLALVAAAFGKIDSVCMPAVLYRQHGKNWAGAKPWNFLEVVRLAATSFRSTCIGKKEILNITQRQAAAFLRRYENRLRASDVKMVRAYANLSQQNLLARRLTILRYRFFMDGILKNLGLMALI